MNLGLAQSLTRLSAQKAKRLIWILLIWLICAPFNSSRAESFVPISLVDAAGKTVSLKSPPKRIVVVGQAPFIPLHIIYMFPEGARSLIGYEKKVKTEEEFLPLIDPDYRSKVALAPNPGAEQIAALKPDLVVTKGNTAGPLHRSLTVLGIPVLHLGVENPEQFMADIRNVGVALGDVKRSAEIIRFYSQRLERIKNTLSANAPLKKPDILVLHFSERGGFSSVKVPARSWTQTIQVQLSGGNPVWTDHISQQENWQIVGFEQIALWNPDKIFMVVWYTLDGPTVIQALRSEKKWRLLKAVSSGELYLFPEDIYGWDTPDPRWILGALWMAKTTYPELFQDMDLRREVIQFFNQLFNMKISVIEKAILPRVTIDEAR